MAAPRWCLTGGVLADLIRRPVAVAPMAGGPATTELITAAMSAGALAFVAAGYRTAVQMRDQIDGIRAATAEPFGINVFVPGEPAGDQDALARYVRDLATSRSPAGPQAGAPAWDDDDFAAKIEDLIARPVPVVSFTFGCPDAEIVRALRAAGSSVWVTVTDPAEAAMAGRSGADCLCVQGAEAGAHRGAFANDTLVPPNPAGVLDLLAAVRAVSDLPLVAAGGIMDAAAAARALAAGAFAVQCGTAFLRCPESGAHAVHKAALADPRFSETAVTRAFSGRPARALVNAFVRDHADAPAAYPEINNATRPLRAAAAAAGDADRMSLYAGQGFRAATTRPAAEVVAMLCEPAG
jgi:nitronate monooxygenase